MGEVYRARDPKLRRDVALKILPAAFAADPERRARFTREAQVLAALNHPHIAAIYGIEEADGVTALVLELVEGPTLDARIAGKPVPIPEALAIAAQIANALDAAHEKGIVHRDLKPANIKLTGDGRVKVLDFGLAKALVDESAPDAAQSPTMTAMASRLGVMVGTAAYMSPEQAKGKAVDKRTDIWAFGCVLYELLTGRRAFAGEDVAEFIAAVLTKEPEWAALPPATPPRIVELLKRCVKKDVRERLHDIADARLEIEDTIAPGSRDPGAGQSAARLVRVTRRETFAWVLVAAAIGVAAWLGFTHARSAPGQAPAAKVLRTTLLLPENVELNNAVISPDGSRVVFGGADVSGKVQLWLRALDADSATVLAGTEGGVLPFWSPDGRLVGFFADKKLKRIEASGRGLLDLYDIDGVGGAWAPNGDILISAPTGPILRLPAGGGKATPVTTLNTSRRETGHRYPCFLPDGRHFLYLSLNMAGNSKDPANQIWVGSLDGAAPRALFSANFNAQYADGHILFIRGGDRGGSLLAQRFDPARLETTGAPIIVAERVAPYGDFLGLSSFSVSANGMLLFDGSRLMTRLEWYDRTGKQTGVFGEPALHSSPRISRDDSRIAFGVYDSGTQTTQVWIGDIARGVKTRLTAGPSSNSRPVWSPDGSRVAFQSDRKHQADIYVQPSNSTGADEAITDEAGQKIPADWSSDGRFLTVYDREPSGNRQVGVSAIPLGGNRKPFLVVPRLYGLTVVGMRLSPDGRWMTYDTDESGREEVYAVSFPAGQGRVQISNAGGTGPMWSRRGREIIFVAPGRMVMSAGIDTSNGFRITTPKALFQLPTGARVDWDISADGERFLINVPVVKSSSVPLSLLVNWAAALTR